MSWQPPAEVTRPSASPHPARSPLLPPARRPGTALFRTGAVIAATCLVLGVICVVKIVMDVLTPVVESGSAPVLRTPFDRSMVLQASEYDVFELADRRTDGSTVISVTPGNVSVIGPDGRPVPVRSRYFETVSRSNGDYTIAAAFMVTTPAPTGSRSAPSRPPR